MNSDEYSYDKVLSICNGLLEKIKIKPIVGIICGSGLGSITDRIKDQQIIKYESIIGFPISTVSGHSGCFIFGKMGDKPVVCMKGRYHLYEGYNSKVCGLPVRVMAGLGISTLILTNAAGGLDRSFNVGDIMIIKDHISIPSLSGFNPLIGPNESRWGERFVALNDAYTLRHRQLAKTIAKELDISIKEGIYCMVSGPIYETPAELSAFLMLGGSAIGMSTIHEVIVAKHMGLNILGLSLITNKCILLNETEGEKPSHEEVLKISNINSAKLMNLIEKWITMLDKQ